MAERSRRMSLDMIRRAVSDISSELGIARYLDLHVTTPSTASSDIHKVECECCGLMEDCTPAYIQHIRHRFCGNWICGLCGEAVNEETQRVGRVEAAVWAHMDACKRFNRIVRLNPAMSLVGAMGEILKKCCQVTHNDGRDNKSQINSNMKIPRSSSCIPMINEGKNYG